KVLTISDTVVTGNRFEARITDSSKYSTGGLALEARVYGTVTVDTGILRPDNLPNTLVLAAAAGDTEISGNTAAEGGGERPANSLYFGGVVGYTDSGPNVTPPAPRYALVDDSPKSDARLEISAAAGRKVTLRDPILVSQTDLANPNLGLRTFAMEVNGEGEFLWGGDNVFRVADDESGSFTALNEISLKQGTVRLLPGMTLDAPLHDLDLGAQALLEIQGRDGPRLTRLALDGFNPAGTLHFVLNPDDVNDPAKPLLTVKLTLPAPAGTVDLSGATVTLSDFSLDRDLAVGEEFYLIDAQAEGALKPGPEGYAVPSNAVASSARTGYSLYRLAVDSRADPDNLAAAGIDPDLAANRFLVARVLEVTPLDPIPPHVDAAGDAYVAGAAHVTMMGSWLAEHCYLSADIAFEIRKGDEAPSAGDGTPAWTVFAGVDASSFSLRDGAETDVKGGQAILGVSRKAQLETGDFLFGGFVEAGAFEYSVATRAAPGHYSAGGRGRTRSLGFGLFARRDWDMGFRIEASARAGRLVNEFTFTDYPVPLGYRGSYTVNTSYVGAHLGLGYKAQVTRSSSLDLTVRGYWTRIQGQSVLVGQDHTLDFGTADSFHVRAGARYSFEAGPWATVYLGGYCDREFNRGNSGSYRGGELGQPVRNGTTGIFELGAVTRPSRNSPGISLSFGVQGYVGKLRGVSGGVRLGYDF
ncbi:MAG: autotransporter outer membrane beta-barrel domain-containing protein, partial [Deltaproteobacteria bacterium]|nr:autotransporter outer membrane beta-barrel domain-containing protein [Deltaproteobacteria bacterium]